LKSLSDSGKDAVEKVDALLSLREVFPETLAINPLFQNALHQAFSSLSKRGAQACAKELFQ